MKQSENSTSIIIVTTTTDSEEEARRIAQSMVGKRLAACAQISGPIESHFWWDGKLDSAKEWQCRLKTSRNRYQELEKEIEKMHSYELPQIVAIDVSAALSGFEQWIRDETNSTG